MSQKFLLKLTLKFHGISLKYQDLTNTVTWAFPARTAMIWAFEYSCGRWSCLILQVKTRVVDFIARWRHLCYKFVQLLIWQTCSKRS